MIEIKQDSNGQRERTNRNKLLLLCEKKFQKQKNTSIVYVFLYSAYHIEIYFFAFRFFHNNFHMLLETESQCALFPSLQVPSPY